MDAVGDTIWVGTLFDTEVSGQAQQTGDGLSFSLDGGASWHHIPNETIFDPARPGFERGPQVAIQSACFGLSLSGSTIWAAFFAGSAVRSQDDGLTWERILPDGAREIVYFAEGR